MKLQEGELIGYLPNQPPAGKLEYTVVLLKDNQAYHSEPGAGRNPF